MKTQTKSRQYEGQCKFCQQDFSKRQIVDHLNRCVKREKGKNIKNLRLRISAPYMKNFWLLAEINEQAKLKDLDNLIRDVWVECCSHLSLFGDYSHEVGKGRVIMDILKPGNTLNYIYDFGSSTELSVEALEYSNFQLDEKKKVELVARNYLPLSDCAKCGQPATEVCTFCSEEELVAACDKCAEKYHNEENEKEEHYILPLVNSPRCGVCGYEGSDDPLDKLF